MTMTSQFTHPLLDRYLAAVGLLLPENEREDIMRELRANLSERFEDIEEANGRPPTDDEVCKVLREHGHPNVVAARYRPQQALVGPMIWPYFTAGLKVVAFLVLMGSFAQAIIGSLAAGGWHGLGSFLPRLMLAVVEIGLPFFGGWVLLMVVAERGWLHGSRTKDWDPRSLKKEGAESLVHSWAEGATEGLKSMASVFSCAESKGRGTAGPEPQASPAEAPKLKRARNRRGEAFSEFFGAVVALGLWYCLFAFPDFFFRHAHFNAVPGEVWSRSYEIMITLLTVQCLVLLPPVIQPFSRPLRHGCMALHSALNAAIAYQFLYDPLLVVTPAQPGQTDISTFVGWIDTWQYTAFAVMIVIAVLQALYRVGKMVASMFKE